ncbi:filamentous hemagglutinin family N-terminal domain protein [Lyngbya aestuarii BL J]|uniref:Filamentous hemagglutinin family N-terminal domain protein n=1 Tax=Lyngbya aestuarii BL J TaxID=1348334 RepID=U7QTT3_9CYAN|nr:filamentous hemagglutinin N-terminal domain-containing protein [Lyngbya aestuarii]ERT09841.1 filamentous hemagglutinin family N-terminal domain protein [Lyngbya aestuarii BL J]
MYFSSLSRTTRAVFIGVVYTVQVAQVNAQILPDNTLGTENSTVVPNQTIRGIRSERIDGGAVRGNNLFHSFQEFNIDEGRGAYFSNPEGIQNILSRVTGENPSNILGVLGVLGNANLF